ncbi:hypothetical protein A1O7_09418 [Cladophialophora yegresii CBS 114405]|uniref:LYR motif-containing protein Cup1-like N-terminal domain-containing protein n=1 Tax=Cladophialophora yegresii CBS 114405 TaxID=1182544 RepID=W9VPL4_9EURO|nr:uncharacterized protein A1O7_09418 [Cladophialophora yegresii CBS 114405]EXJ54081.1 hypothetical protein A1O7_09418 [Cladophialophora yegresii CBS 114405]
MPPPESNPLHIYRACLRECSYLPLPQCRSYMRKFTIEKFRSFIPRRSGRNKPGRKNNPGNAPVLAPETVTHLLRLARKYAAVLRHANHGHTPQLQKVLRMTYGRVGPHKYKLLAKFLNPSADTAGGRSTLLMEPDGEEEDGEKVLNDPGGDDGLEELLEDEEAAEDAGSTPEKDTLYPSLCPTVSTTAFTTFYKEAKVPDPPVEEKPPSWKLDVPPRLQALLVSQSHEQPHFTRVGSSRRVRLRFSPPTHTIWGKPLPFSRYKNQRIKWYKHNMQAALPPLESEAAYWEVHNLVTGRTEFPAPIPRRTSARLSAEDDLRESLQKQSSLLLEGPSFGSRLKGMGRRHEITPRLLQRMLSRVVLSQTPLVKTAAPGTKTEADSGVVIYWDDGMSHQRYSRAQERIREPVPEKQAGLLFA